MYKHSFEYRLYSRSPVTSLHVRLTLTLTFLHLQNTLIYQGLLNSFISADISSSLASINFMVSFPYFNSDRMLSLFSLSESTPSPSFLFNDCISDVISPITPINFVSSKRFMSLIFNSSTTLEQYNNHQNAPT